MDWVEFFTSKEGIFAATGGLVSLLAAFLGIVRPIAQRRREKAAAKAKLEITEPILTPPPEHSQIGEVRFELSNAGSSKAVLRALRIVVTDHGPSETLRMVRPGAPVTVHSHRVELDPAKSEYDVRSPVYAADTPPLSFEEGEVEAFVVRLVSTEAQWYRFRLVAEWYDAKRAKAIRKVESGELEIDFPPDLEEFLASKEDQDRGQ